MENDWRLIGVLKQKLTENVENDGNSNERESSCNDSKTSRCVGQLAQGLDDNGKEAHDLKESKQPRI